MEQLLSGNEELVNDVSLGIYRRKVPCVLRNNRELSPQ